MKDSDWGLESETDLHPDVPGELSAGPDTAHLEISQPYLLTEIHLLLANFSRIFGHQLLQGPPHLPAGRSRLLLALAPHHVDFPASEDGGAGQRLTDLTREI